MDDSPPIVIRMRITITIKWMTRCQLQSSTQQWYGTALTMLVQCRWPVSVKKRKHLNKYHWKPGRSRNLPKVLIQLEFLPMHWSRARAIKEGQFRFANLASHFKRKFHIHFSENCEKLMTTFLTFKNPFTFYSNTSMKSAQFFQSGPNQMNNFSHLISQISADKATSWGRGQF